MAEYGFVCSLWPYESLRLLYAWHGLCHSLPGEVARSIVSLFMCHFDESAQCPGSLHTERRVYTNHGLSPSLYTDLRAHLWRFYKDKPERERLQLKSIGVPKWRRLMVVGERGEKTRLRYKWDDYDTTDTFTAHTKKGVALPPRFTFSCIDLMNDDAIKRANLGWTDEEIKEFRHQRWMSQGALAPPLLCVVQ
jgi:hypothetical protein